ncbi:MAG: hypothetical protein C0405_08190 [Desulfovibrio sp.]|nr:hypothetical protein [Desulfovibrio sp.]
MCTPNCGDGIVVGAEPCDSADLGQKTCLTLNYYGGTLACNGDCTLDLTSCAAAGSCGDGAAQVADGEVCDGDDLQLASCASQGYYGGTLACAADCTFLLTDCALYGRCGDDTLHAASGEACDGTALGTSSCLSLGYYGGSIACTSVCQYDLAPCIAAGRCGDGVLQSAASELCDTTIFRSSDSCISQADLAYGDLTCLGDCRTIGIGACYGKRYLRVAGTFASTCAIDNNNKAWCWGSGAEGTLGNGANSNSILPVQTSGNYNFTQIAEGGDRHFCGLISGGAIRCWGLNDNGQLGDNSTTNRNVPTLVSSAAAYTQVATGYYHNCALSSVNQVYCWGLNTDGQLGNGSTTPRLVPYAITTGSYNFVAAGGYHSCALDTTGKAWCWGYNTKGQLGNNSTVSSSSRVAVSGPLLFSKIYAGDQSTCALTSIGVAYCWGEGGSGQLGRGSTADSLEPVQVSGGLSFAQLAIYSSHVCGITTAGALYCWGYNNVGQLGLGNTTNQTTPQQVTPLTRYSHVGAGAYHTCAVESAGGLWCWGENANSQLGNGGTTDSTVPVLTSSP